MNREIRTALITGGARGIGRQIALDLGKAGYNVVINYNKSKEAAIALVNELSELEIAAYAVCADVSDHAAVMNMASQVKKVDVLVNNAGISHFGLIGDDTESDFERVIGVDLKGVWNCCRAFMPGMISRGFGRIINISSFWSVRGSCMESLYSAAKAGVNGLTKALSREAGERVTVNAILAGLIDTDMNADADKTSLDRIIADTPAGRMGTPRDISRTVLFLADEEASFINGALINIDGGY